MAHGSSRRQVAHQFATNVPDKFIEIKVAYSDGGASFTDLGGGRDANRSFYLHVTPVKIETSPGGVQIKSFMLYSGFKQKLEDVKRFSAKKLDELTERTRRECEARDETIMQIVNRVLAQENLTLQEAVHA